MNYTFNPSVVLLNWVGLAHGVEVTLILSFTSFIGALLFGLIAALGRLSSHRAVNMIAGAYIEFVRNTPLVVQLVWIYYCLPILIGINMPGMQAAIIGLSVGESGNVAEIIRGGIRAIPKGQIEAAKAVGFSPATTMMRVILPQAFRLMIPPLLNSFVALLKATALVAIIAVPDLMFVAQRMSAETFRPIELLTAAAIIYFLIAYPIVLCVRRIERRAWSHL